jgi:hypothetical protein
VPAAVNLPSEDADDRSVQDLAAMMGRRSAQGTLFDAGNVFPVELDPKTFHGQLAEAAPHLFRDELFQAIYDQRAGRPSVPPSQRVRFRCRAAAARLSASVH